MQFLKARAAVVWLTLVDFAREAGIGFDQFINALSGVLKVMGSLFTGERPLPAFADETLSARTWRAARRGKRMGLMFRPVIDLLFSWQHVDPTIKDEHDVIVPGHCQRAYLKERLRRGLPPEYRQT